MDRSSREYHHPTIRSRPTNKNQHRTEGRSGQTCRRNGNNLPHKSKLPRTCRPTFDSRRQTDLPIHADFRRTETSANGHHFPNDCPVSLHDRIHLDDIRVRTGNETSKHTATRGNHRAEKSSFTTARRK